MDLNTWIDRFTTPIPLAIAEREAAHFDRETDGFLPVVPVQCADCKGEGCGYCDETGTDQDHYPAWGTVWVWQGLDDETFREIAQDAGFVIIEQFGDFNGPLLGVNGGGYSFHEAHWTPLREALAKARGY